MTGSLNPCYSIYGQSLNSDRHNEWSNQRQTSYIRYITENLSYIFVFYYFLSFYTKKFLTSFGAIIA